MRKLNFFKTLLVAVGLSAGVNAWGDDIYPSATQIQSSVTDATGSTATSWTIGQVQASGDNGFKGTGKCVIAKFDLTSALNGKSLVSANLKFSVTAGAYNSSLNVFVIDSDFDASTAYWGNPSPYRISTITSAADWSNKNSKKEFSYDVKSVIDSDEDNIVAFLLAVNTAREQTLSDLYMEISASDASSVTSFTIEKYEVDGDLISSESGIDGIVGKTASAESAEATFYNADGSKKYVFDSANTNNVVSKVLVADAEENVLKLYFNSYSKYTATVSTICGENSVADITGSWYADEDPKTLYWPKVLSCPDGYYIVDAEESTPNYGHTFSSSDLTKTVTYTLDEDIVYYAEYENLLTDKNSYEYFSAQSSKGTSRCIQKTGVMKTSIGLASTGVYNIVFACGNRDGSHTATLDMKLIDSDNNISSDNVLYATFTSNEWKGELKANNVTIPAGSELYFANDNGEGNARIAGDYIIVKKCYAPKTISPAGYATYCSPYALNFEGTGLTAYRATVGSDKKVTFTEVEQVPANEGVLLKGTAGNYNIPVIASAEAIENDFVGVTEEKADVAAGIFVLMNGDKGVGFYKTSTAFTVGANTAYLPALPTLESRGFIGFDFDDEVTGISAVKTVKNTEAIYNLNGQRVKNATKGLFIKNGKKFVNK